MEHKNFKSLILVLMALPALLIAQAANASYMIEFEKLSANAPVDYSDNYSVLLEETATGVSFKVTNAYTDPSSITGVYFEYGDSNTTVNSFTESDGMGSDVEFYSPGSPDHLPGGNAYFDNPADYSAHTNGISGGIDSGTEYITFLATLGTDYQSLLNAINAGTFRIGLHVQGILPDDGDFSDAYVNVVPVPAAAWLFGSALIGFFAASRRRKSVG